MSDMWSAGVAGLALAAVQAFVWWSVLQQAKKKTWIAQLMAGAGHMYSSDLVVNLGLAREGETHLSVSD